MLHFFFFFDVLPDVEHRKTAQRQGAGSPEAAPFGNSPEAAGAGRQADFRAGLPLPALRSLRTAADA